MILGRVEGTVVCTVKHPKFANRTLLVVQPLDEERQPQGRSLVAEIEATQVEVRRAKANQQALLRSLGVQEATNEASLRELASPTCPKRCSTPRPRCSANCAPARRTG